VWSRYDFVWLGQSYRATEMEAALGLGQLDRLSTNLARRREVAGLLTDALGHADLQLPSIAPGNEHAFMMFPIICRSPGLRDRLVLALERAGVETRFLLPILGQPCYEGVLEYPSGTFPVAERALGNGFYIGCHPGMTADDVEYIAAIVAGAIREGQGN
jgi:dTDP-4-amino-4,6-dideoxygalactose transaminase